MGLIPLATTRWMRWSFRTRAGVGARRGLVCSRWCVRWTPCRNGQACSLNTTSSFRLIRSAKMHGWALHGLEDIQTTGLKTPRCKLSALTQYLPNHLSASLSTRVAAFATVTHDKTGTKWVSSSNRDEGATEHEIWRVSEDDTMEIEYLEDNGSQCIFLSHRAIHLTHRNIVLPSTLKQKLTA